MEAPEGRRHAERLCPSPLRGFEVVFTTAPQVETWGYSPASLRDFRASKARPRAGWEPARPGAS